MAAHETRLPAAVRRQRDEVNEILRQQQEDRDGSEPTGSDAAAPAAVVVDAAASSLPSTPSAALDSAPRVAATTGAPFDPNTATADQLREELKKSNARFLTLQGKYGAEVPRLHRDVRELKQQNRDLQEQQQRTPTPPPAAQPAPALTQASLKASPRYQELVEHLGTDVADSMLGWVEEAVQSRAAPASPAPIPQASARTPETQPAGRETSGPENPSEQALADYVDTMIGPDAFNRIDKTDAFQAWLLEFDHRENSIRKQALIKAFRSGDIHRAAGFWIDWDQRNPAGTPKPDLREPLVESDTRSADGDASDMEAEYVTTSEIDAFYKAVTTGKFKGREQEKRRQEARINAATSSGRVIR